MEELAVDSHYSYFIAEYMGHRFKVPVYPWEALEPYWASIAMAITKTLIYNRFSPECYKDHKLWRANRMGLEALLFADLLTRDRSFRKAVKEFNAKASSLKFNGDWLQPFDTGQSTDFWNHLAQLGQLIYNSMKFLLDTGYLLVYGDLVKIIRPYWCPPAEWVLMKEWAAKTIRFIENFQAYTGRYPGLKDIAFFWRVPRRVLVEAGVTLEMIREAYRHYKRTGEVKIIKADKEYKRLTEEEQKQLAMKIAKRVHFR
ncbi:MAG: hypothetical protein NZ932_04070 [Candidatus Bathyarchaeota archaeon]|nr:hypothetical protein [Candidatus Bathyarchaeota archaeon]MDW8022354.1 hypothetical protein [Nitrososphaerota archaeon]